MNEKEGKKRVVKLKDCMWCDFFNDSKCDLEVEVKTIKIIKYGTYINKTYAAVEYLKCIAKRKEYSNEKKKIL